MISIVIPSYRDPYLLPTITSLLDNATGEIEIIPVLDGYWPDRVHPDRRVKYLHLGANRGMRRAINAGVAAAKGEFLMRTDEHCAFGPEYDRILTETCQPNWIVTPRRYALNPEQWEIMPEIPPVDYMDLRIVGAGEGRKFSGVAKPGDDSQPIQESMAMQGSCWLMARSWWDSVIGELQNEGYGPHYQDSHEMVFKTWQAGGKLMVNKHTWHAHKHRRFSRTHNNGTPENPSNNDQCFAYSLQVWEPYYRNVVLPAWGKSWRT
jgi:glycosyltransferase involved in cell wall biosynthesis